MEGYSFDNSRESMKKTIYFALKNMGMECSMEKNGVSVIKKCIFEEGAESVGIKDKILFPKCIHFIKGIASNFEGDVVVRDAKCLGNEKCFIEIE